MLKKSKWSSSPWIIMFSISKPNGDVFYKYQYFVEDTPKKQVFAIAEKHKPAHTLQTHVFRAKLVAEDITIDW